MRWNGYDWTAVAVGVLAYGVATLASLFLLDSLVLFEPLIVIVLGAVVGGTITGSLAAPNRDVFRHGIVTGVGGMVVLLCGLAAYGAATLPPGADVPSLVVAVAMVGVFVFALAAGPVAAVAGLSAATASRLVGS